VTFGSKPRHLLGDLPHDVEYHAQPADRELAPLYGSCTAWLFASRREGYGLPILEAMACRTPVIATRAGAAPELIKRGGGWLIPTEDARAMANAITAACNLSPKQWVEASEAAYQSVTSHTWADAGDAFAAALERAVARRSLAQSD